MDWVGTVLAEAERQGIARERLLALAGLADADLGQERWPIDHITRLWHAAVQCTQDAGFGLKAGLGVDPANFQRVGAILRASPTLRAALAAVQKYQRLISDGGRFQLIAGDADTWIIYHPRQGKLAFSPHQIEAVLAAVVALARRVTGQALLQPQCVQFSQAQLGPLAGYRAVFACPVAFEQAFSGLLLANAILDAPLPQADGRQVREHHRQAAQQLAGLARGAALAQELRAWMVGELQQRVPERASAAKALGLSERTLARRMQAQQLSFTGLLDAVRREAALQAVADTRQPLADIGQRLGFAEPAVFWRAFKRWTGCTPAQWRSRHLAD